MLQRFFYFFLIRLLPISLIRLFGAKIGTLLCMSMICSPTAWSAEPAPSVTFVQPAQHINHGLNVRPIKPDSVDTVSMLLTDDQGRPTSGTLIQAFPVLQPDEAGASLHIDPTTTSSSADGSASFDVSIGKHPGRYRVAFVSQSTSGTQGKLNQVEYVAQPSNWATMLLLGLLGGVALFLLGLRLASEGLESFAAKRLRSALGKLTSSQWKALLLGIAITLVTQSSGATTVMIMSFIRARVLSLRNSLAIILGAALAGTFTVQLIAFDLFNYALPAIGIGFPFYLLARRPRWKAFGLVSMGFGMLFLGIHVMTDQLAPLKNFQFFQGAVSSLALHPGWSMILSAVFTAGAQSSGATMGVVMALANEQILSVEQAVPLFYGAAIGICVTGLLAGFEAPVEARRLAWGHLVFKVAGVLLFLPLVEPLAWAGKAVTEFFVSPESAAFPARAIANTYMLYMAVTVLLALPFTGLIERLVERFVPEGPQDKMDGDTRIKYLDPSAISTPAVAMGSARREISRMGRFVEEMLRAARAGLMEKDSSSVSTIHKRDNKVDALNRSIMRYLNQIAKQAEDTPQGETIMDLLHIISDLEAIGDIIDKNLVPLAEKMIATDMEFSNEGESELNDLYSKVQERLSQMLVSLTTGDSEIAEVIIGGFSPLQAEGKRLHTRHLRRLQNDQPQSLETSSVHLDVLHYLLRIDYLIFSICLHVAGRADAVAE
jgi:phosphate:Na+ symporter